jgi:hypothetical protein
LGADLLLVDLGGTTEEVVGAIGPSGYLRAMFSTSRNAQIRAVARWLAGGNGGTRH